VFLCLRSSREHCRRRVLLALSVVSDSGQLTGSVLSYLQCTALQQSCIRGHFVIIPNRAARIVKQRFVKAQRLSGEFRSDFWTLYYDVITQNFVSSSSDMWFLLLLEVLGSWTCTFSLPMTPSSLHCAISFSCS